MVANRKWNLLMAACLLWAAFPVAWLLHPLVMKSRMVLCGFRAITGHPCPFCGLTRAFACATHGEFAEASAFHPFWWFFFLLVAGLGTVACVDALADTHYMRRLQEAFIHHPWLVLIVLLLLSILRALAPLPEG